MSLINETSLLTARILRRWSGDAATVASLVNAAPRVLKAPPGLLLMTDIGVPSFA